jgi:hypothetical protein
MSELVFVLAIGTPTPKDAVGDDGFSAVVGQQR